MARKQIVTYSFTCDLCGNEIPEGTEGTARRVSFEGREYQVDLCDKDQRGLDKALVGLRPYIEAGRRLGEGGRGRRSSGGAGHGAAGRGAAGRTNTRVMREWARRNGWPKLGSRGRVPNEAVQAWEAAGSPGA